MMELRSFENSLSLRSSRTWYHCALCRSMPFRCAHFQPPLRASQVPVSLAGLSIRIWAIKSGLNKSANAPGKMKRRRDLITSRKHLRIFKICCEVDIPLKQPRRPLSSSVAVLLHSVV